MNIPIWIVAGAALLVGLDHILLWAERQGWVYWRKTKGRRGGIGEAFLGAETLINPGAEHVREAKQTKKREDRAAGDPPEINS